jgi:hypothetical protein
MYVQYLTILFAEGEVIIGEYSPRPRNNCFSIFTQVFCVFWDWIYFNFAYFFISNFQKKIHL